MNKSNGLPVVLSAPSGGGKSTIAEEVIKRVPRVVRSLSCTTRSPREGETDGIDYQFVSQDEFKKTIEEGGFLEWAVVHGNYYGTPLSALKKNLERGNDVLLVIDPQGAISLKRFYPSGVYVFIIPPTWEILEKRLNDRATDSKKTKEIRLANARKELSYMSHYDYVVVNENLEKAIDDVVAILRAEHNRLTRINRNTISILK